MAKQICAKCGTEYDGVADDGSAAVCPNDGFDQYQTEGLVPDGWEPPDPAPPPEPADQLPPPLDSESPEGGTANAGVPAAEEAQPPLPPGVG
jgi:hypothetical protein